MTIETQIINGTTVVINEQTDPILGITIIIALITLGGIIWSNLQTRKSNKISEHNLESIKPVLAIGDIVPLNVELYNGRKISWDRVNEQNIPANHFKTVFLGSQVRNVGGITAKNVKGKILYAQKQMTKQDIQKAKAETEVPLIVNDSYPFIIPISGNNFVNLKNQPIYIGINLEFDSLLETKTQTGKIWEIHYGTGIIMDSWIDENQIK